MIPTIFNARKRKDEAELARVSSSDTPTSFAVRSSRLRNPDTGERIKKGSIVSQVVKTTPGVPSSGTKVENIESAPYPQKTNEVKAPKQKTVLGNAASYFLDEKGNKKDNSYGATEHRGTFTRKDYEDAMADPSKYKDDHPLVSSYGTYADMRKEFRDNPNLHSVDVGYLDESKLPQGMMVNGKLQRTPGVGKTGDNVYRKVYNEPEEKKTDIGSGPIKSDYVAGTPPTTKKNLVIKAPVKSGLGIQTRRVSGTDRSGRGQNYKRVDAVIGNARIPILKIKTKTRSTK